MGAAYASILVLNDATERSVTMSWVVNFMMVGQIEINKLERKKSDVWNEMKFKCCGCKRRCFFWMNPI